MKFNHRISDRLKELADIDNAEENSILLTKEEVHDRMVHLIEAATEMHYKLSQTLQTLEVPYSEHPAYMTDFADALFDLGLKQ